MALFIVSQDREVVEQVRATLLEIDTSSAVNAVGSAEALRLRLQDDSEGHVVLIDLRVNDGLGLDLAREITMSWPLVATLLLTTERGNQIYESASSASLVGGLFDEGSRSDRLDTDCSSSRRRFCYRTATSNRTSYRRCRGKGGSGDLSTCTFISA